MIKYLMLLRYKVYKVFIKYICFKIKFWGTQFAIGYF